VVLEWTFSNFVLYTERFDRQQHVSLVVEDYHTGRGELSARWVGQRRVVSASATAL
jgi:hypothetical protein